MGGKGNMLEGGCSMKTRWAILAAGIFLSAVLLGCTTTAKKASNTEPQ
jgi:hypothetical protein